MTHRELRLLRRDAYSLTELLIVMVILVMMVAAALPLAKRVLDENRVREASRQLNAYISMAKTRAVLTGRPCGVFFELAAPLGADPGPTSIMPNRFNRQSTRMYLAETPPPYAGSVIGGKGRIMWWPDMGAANPQFCPLYYNSMTSRYERDDLGEMLVLKSLIDEGEQFLVRFDYKGPWYQCIRGSAASSTYTDPDKLYAVTQAIGMYTFPTTLAGTATPVAPGYIADPAAEPYTNPGYSYQILRSPRRVGNPLELTGGTCVDMNYSGMGVTDSNSFRLASGAMAIMFTPSGGVTGIYGDGVGPVPPEGTVHFLIGRTTKVNNPLGANAAHDSGINLFDPQMSNLADASTLWVSVGRQNGATSTSENVPPPVDEATLSTTNVTIFPGEAAVPAGRRQNLDPSAQADRATYLQHCRSIATGREQTGGR